MGVDGAVAHVGIEGIPFVEQLLARLHVARMADQRLQDQKFRESQLHRLFFPGHQITLEVERNRPADQELIVGFVARGLAHTFAVAVDAGQRQTPEKHPHAGDQLPHGEGFTEVVVGPELETEHPVELLIARRQEKDRQAFRRCPQAAAKLETIHTRHQDVEDHHVGGLRRKTLPGSQAVGETDRFVTLFAQGIKHGLPQIFFVVGKYHPTLAHPFFLVVGSRLSSRRK